MVYKVWDKPETRGIVDARTQLSLQIYKSSGFLTPSILSFPERIFAKDVQTQIPC